MTDRINHPLYQSMLRAASVQAPLHDDLPPFAEQPMNVKDVVYPLTAPVFVAPDTTIEPEPNLCWSYERATD
jgi:hypothetical protein